MFQGMNPRDPRITGPGGHSDPASSRFQPGKALLFPPSITERVTIGERIVFMAFIEARGYAIGKKPSCSVAFLSEEFAQTMPRFGMRGIAAEDGLEK